ncbi:hypothetical protein FPOA_00078 [Fusarium poae]|uniref:Uncharacterized protein n=1 Tax=Fusarium poae TaxID=36050 RepID=A0A1B8B061_FUSPO|nr:hypothetical protein FPOA_00078 [Fusarium poae]
MLTWIPTYIYTHVLVLDLKLFTSSSSITINLSSFSKESHTYFQIPSYKVKMPSADGLLRVLEPEFLEFDFFGLKSMIVKLNQPIYGVESARVTLEYDSESQLNSRHSVRGKIEGKALTLDVGNGVKIVGNLDQSERFQQIDGYGDWAI